MSNTSGNIFCDLHHGDLYYALHLLFEERLGYNLYRPIGLEWFEKGFWKIAEPYHNAPDTIDQYLGIPKSTWSKTKEPIQKYGDVELRDDVYHIPLRVPGGSYTQKAITFDKFLKTDFDFIVATYNAHDQAYTRLAEQHKPNAICIRQIGNVFEYPVLCRNVLLSEMTPMPPDVNWMRYWPETNREYRYTVPTNHSTVKSFIAAPLGEPNLPLFYEYEKLLPDFAFKMHGILGRDGVISAELMPQVMKDSAFVWHVKHTGCGGFVAREALACGRPLVVKNHLTRNYYNLEMDLFEDGVNCIDLDLGSMKDNVEKIRYFSDPERHTEMCRNTADKFRKDVNFDEEAKKMRAWLEDLKR